MIKIEPLFATDSTQMRALLRQQDEPVPYDSFCAEDAVSRSGMTFWQHWLPCKWHIAPSVYVAKDDGVMLGLISVSSVSKARACWRINHLVVQQQQRGRGIAQELLRYAIALFGSQGVSHFVAEVSASNGPALSLLNTCGFRRSARLTQFQVPPDRKLEIGKVDLSAFRLALPADQNALYQLHQDALPPDLRLVYDYQASDFSVAELPPESSERVFKRLLRNKVWYWVCPDNERKVLCAAIKVTAHREGDYHLDFALHPGWAHLAPDTVAFALNMASRIGMKGVILSKAYDYQQPIVDALQNSGMESAGEFALLAREHWLRAKTPRAIKLDVVPMPTIANPVINLPRQFDPGASINN